MNELDQLMDLDPLQLSDQDIDRIIDYQRKMQANFEAGVKPKKAEGPKIDLLTLVKGAAPPKPEMKRRF